MIRSLEQISRFMIISIHEGYIYPKDKFDQQQNLERLTSTLKTLSYCYSRVRANPAIPEEEKLRLLKNGAEFSSYKILAEAKSQL